MRSRSVKPSQYPPLPFHLIRCIALFSSVVVAVILSIFTYNLHSAGQKLPWAFLVLIISVFVSILNYILTTLVHCCYGLSPRLSIITNTIVFILWFIAFVLLAWSMSHTILTTCNTTFWATSTGITVCRIYKALFSFTVIGITAHIAAIILDARVYRRQTRLGEYDPMLNPNAASGGIPLPDYKTHHDRNSSVMSTSAFSHPTDDDRYPLVPPPQQHYHQRHRSDLDVSDGDDDLGLARPVPPSYSSAGNASLEQYHAGEAQVYSDSAPLRSQRGVPRVRFSVYDTEYARPAEQTGYDPAAYR